MLFKRITASSGFLVRNLEPWIERQKSGKSGYGPLQDINALLIIMRPARATFNNESYFILYIITNWTLQITIIAMCAALCFIK